MTTRASKRTLDGQSSQSARRAQPPVKPADVAPPAFPQRLRHSTQQPQLVYELAQDLYAVREAPQASAARALQRQTPMLTLEGEGGAQFQIYRAASDAVPGVARRTAAPRKPKDTLPVYARGSGSAVVVPTGRLFVRFADAIQATTRADELGRLGLRITQTLSYAPNAAWVESDRGVGVALSSIEAVEKLADVQNVEPQLLGSRASRA